MSMNRVLSKQVFIPTRCFSQKPRKEKKIEYQPILNSTKSIDPMAYIYEKNPLQRAKMKEKLSSTKLPFRKIPDTSSKFQIRTRQPGVYGAVSRASQYTVSPVVIEDSIWAYDESEDTGMILERKKDQTAEEEAGEGIGRDSSGRVIDDDASTYFSLNLQELQLMARGRGPYKVNPADVNVPEDEEEEFIMDVESSNPSYAQLLSKEYIPSVAMARVMGSVRPGMRNQPSYIRAMPIFNAMAARTIAFRYMHNNVDSGVASVANNELQQKKKEFEAMNTDDSRAEEYLQEGLLWMARAAYAGDGEAAGILAVHCEDLLSEFLGFVETNEQGADDLHAGIGSSDLNTTEQEEMPEDLRDAVQILHSDSMKYLFSKIQGQKVAIPDLQHSHPLHLAIYYHEQSVLLRKSPEAQAQMAEWVLGQDELLYQCVEEENLEEVHKFVNKMQIKPIQPIDVEEDHIIDIEDDQDEDQLLPNGIMGLYLYWFLQPIVRFPSLAGDTAVLLARLASVYDPESQAKWQQLGRQLGGMSQEARLHTMQQNSTMPIMDV